MQNKLGFIYSKNLPQPHYYKQFFDLYCAVYIADNDVEYHLQLIGNTAINRIDGIDILRQDKTCRSQITFKTFKTIKSAVLFLMNYLESNNLMRKIAPLKDKKQLTYYGSDLKKRTISQSLLDKINSESDVKLIISRDQIDGKIPMLAFYDKDSGVEIINPFLSTCGRFEVNPVEFGLTENQIQLFKNTEIDYDEYSDLINLLFTK